MWSNAFEWVVGVGVFGIVTQVWSVRRSARLTFEQHFTDRYRQVVARIPLIHLWGDCESHLDVPDGMDPASVERAYFDYFELCEEQFYYRKSGRISNATWRDWAIGITSNGKLPTFKSAWQDFETRRGQFCRGDLFGELVESKVLASDPPRRVDPIERWRLQRWTSIVSRSVR